MRVILRNASWVVTPAGTLHEADVAVSDERIESIQEARIHGPADEEIDLAGCLLIPGLISLHHHFFQHATRAWPPLHRAASEDWLVTLYGVWAQMDTREAVAAARNAAAELLLSGATTAVDHAFLLGRGHERLEAQLDAVCALGLRLHLVRSGLPTIGGRVQARLAPAVVDALLDKQDAWLAQCRADIRRWHDPAAGSLLRLDLGPSNIAYDKPALMRALADMAAEHGCGLHAHYHPRTSERDLCRARNRVEPIDYLDQVGWLRPRTWFAHCTELDDEEIQRFAAAGVGIAHCPRTVLRLGYRLPRVHAWRAAKVKVGIGVDGGASNDSGTFISDVRLALLLHRAGGLDSAHWLRPEDALAMATTDAAAILGRPELGAIEPGKRADLAAFDLRGLDVAGALADPLGGFLLAGSTTRTQLTMVNGRVVVRNGRLATGNEATIAEETNARNRALRARLFPSPPSRSTGRRAPSGS